MFFCFFWFKNNSIIYMWAFELAPKFLLASLDHHKSQQRYGHCCMFSYKPWVNLASLKIPSLSYETLSFEDYITNGYIWENIENPYQTFARFLNNVCNFEMDINMQNWMQLLQSKIMSTKETTRSSKIFKYALWSPLQWDIPICTISKGMMFQVQ